VPLANSQRPSVVFCHSAGCRMARWLDIAPTNAGRSMLPEWLCRGTAGRTMRSILGGRRLALVSSETRLISGYRQNCFKVQCAFFGGGAVHGAEFCGPHGEGPDNHRQCAALTRSRGRKIGREGLTDDRPRFGRQRRAWRVIVRGFKGSNSRSRCTNAPRPKRQGPWPRSRCPKHAFTGGVGRPIGLRCSAGQGPS